MTDRDPIRLIDDEEAGEALSVDLARAVEHRVDYDVAAGVAAFEASLVGAPPAGVEASVSTAAGGSAAGGKIMLVVFGVVAAVGVGAVAISGESEAPPGRAARAEAPKDDPRPPLVPEPPSVETPEPAAIAVPTVLPSVETDTAPEPSESDAPPPDRPPKQRSTKAKPVAPKAAPPEPAVDKLRAEMEATDRAAKALAGNPARALALAREADAAFEKGLFAEQRAGIKALALFGLGKTDAATKAAERYLRKYPKGTYADKVRARIDKKP
ncbi:MAG: hypothetical protein AAF721_07670 [Myxococcota bacterium]